MNRYSVVVISTVLSVQFLMLIVGIEGSLLQNALAQPNPIMNASSTSTSTDSTTNTVTANYFARFNCGAINDDNGPLRPGKYDSDITIFNKKDFPVTVIWKAIAVYQQYNSNYNILSVPSEKIVNINCEKIYPSSQISSGNRNTGNNNSTN